MINACANCNSSRRSDLRAGESIADRRALSNLRSPRVWERQGAVEHLAKRGAPLQLLLPLLTDRAPEVRVAVIGAMALADDGEASGIVDHLLGAIDDPDHFVTAAAIHALKCLKAEQPLEQIVAVLDDWVEATIVRSSEHHPFCIARAAVGYLAELGPMEVGAHLTPLLGLRWPIIRSLGARAIGRLGYTPAVPTLIRALELCVELDAQMEVDYRGADYREADAYFYALTQLRGLEAVPVLIRIAREVVGHRSKAVQALTVLAPEEAAPHLVGMLTDQSQKLWSGLLKLIVKSNHRPALPAIRVMLHDGNHEKRSAALRALAELHDRDAADDIRSLCLNDPNPHVRPKAVAALARLLGEEASMTLKAMVNDTNARVRRVAAAELHQLERARRTARPAPAVLDRPGRHQVPRLEASLRQGQ